MTDEERKMALYCLKASSDYHSEVCEECINYPNCDHTGQDDVTETIIKALEQEPCEDTISRQAVVGYLCTHCPDDAECFKDCDDIKNIKALPPVIPQPKTGHWIPVSERLPEFRKEVLTCSNGGFIEIQSLEDSCADIYWENQKGDWSDFDEIIAWMPLPSPYEPQERSGEE